MIVRSQQYDSNQHILILFETPSINWDPKLLLLEKQSTLKDNIVPDMYIRQWQRLHWELSCGASSKCLEAVPPMDAWEKASVQVLVLSPSLSLSVFCVYYLIFINFDFLYGPWHILRSFKPVCCTLRRFVPSDSNSHFGWTSKLYFHFYRSATTL